MENFLNEKKGMPLGVNIHFKVDPLEAKIIISYVIGKIQARIAQLVAYQLGTREVPGSNPSKGENFSVKISHWIVRI